MVDVIRREPVHAVHVDAEPREDTGADIVPAELVALTLGFRSHGAHEPGVTRTLHWEHGEEVGIIERHVELAVHDGAARLHVGDVEQVLVGASRKSDAQDLAHDGMRTVATGDVRGAAVLLRAVGPAETRGYVIAAVLEVDQRRAALDLDAARRQLRDQHALVLVLREDQRIRERAEAHTDIAERDTPGLRAANPQVRRDEPTPSLDDVTRETEMVVEL